MEGDLKINPEWKDADFEYCSRRGYWVPTESYLKRTQRDMIYESALARHNELFPKPPVEPKK